MCQREMETHIRFILILFLVLKCVFLLSLKSLLHSLSLTLTSSSSPPPSHNQAGLQTPLFFGSAMTNFGVELFLKNFLQLARSPAGRQALVEGGGSSSGSGDGRSGSTDVDGGAGSDGSGDGSSDAADDSASETDGIGSEKETDVGTVEDIGNSAAEVGSKSKNKADIQQHRIILPSDDEFSGFVFKLQANLDPRHRDRMAFVRICSGVFRKGMKVNHSRMRRSINLSAAQSLFAQERESITEAYPGDVIGIHNPGVFSIGDTIYTGGNRITYPGIPSFSPEKFAYIRNLNPSAYKKFQKVRQQRGYAALL